MFFDKPAKHVKKEVRLLIQGEGYSKEQAQRLIANNRFDVDLAIERNIEPRNICANLLQESTFKQAFTG